MKFIVESDVETFAHLCCAVERAPATGTLSYNMRKLLRPQRFLWNWYSACGDLVLWSRDSHFPTLQSCQDDAQKYTFLASKLAGSGTGLILDIVACFSNGKEIGTVLEIADPAKCYKQIDLMVEMFQSLNPLLSDVSPHIHHRK